MWFKTGRSFFVCLLLIFMFAGVVQAGSEPVFIKHKVVLKEDNLKAIVPIVNGVEDKKLEKAINERLLEMINIRIASYKELGKDKRLTKEMKSHYTFNSDYAVKYNKYGLLSIVTSGYYYTGGAHGMSWRDSLNVDLNSGKFYTLPDLFKEGFDYKGVIDQKIRKEIVFRDWTSVCQFNGVNEKTRFYLTDEFLVIYYQPYEIGPYVLGRARFYIPIDDLRANLIDDLKIW